MTRILLLMQHRFTASQMLLAAGSVFVATQICHGTEGRSAISPAELQCEYSSNPLGIDVPNPRLSWKLSGQEPESAQTAYRIQAASSPELLAAGQADLWDSGQVASDETLHVRYQGSPLKSWQLVYWRIKVTDQRSQDSTWSAPASWTMGVLNPEDWMAKWVCAPSTSESLLLRKDFVVRPQLKRAVLCVSGLGQHEVRLNGKKVGQHLLAPGWTDYNDTILYETFEVTPFLRTGQNTVGMVLGNGMYHVVRRNRFAKFTGSFGPLRAICQLHLEFADGSTDSVVTDETWRTNPGPITYSSIYGGEDFDARLDPIGWDRPGFDVGKWSSAVTVVRPSGNLKGQHRSSEPIEAIEVREPVNVQELTSPAIKVYDFGQNASYIPRLRVTGPKGSTVRLIPAEVVNADGSILRSTMGSTNRGISWWQYTKATNLEESWFPQFYYVGCRYLQAELNPAKSGGKLPVVTALDGVIVHSTAAPTGQFQCSNPLLNRIRDLVRWAQRANMVSVLTDCPHREKLGWLEQYHLNGPSIRYEFDMARMFTKGMSDMADAQLENGLVPNIAPEYTQFSGPFRAAAEWGSAFIIVPWQQYQFCGDLDLLREHYPAMKRYFAYLESRAQDDILSEGLGDWYDVGPRKLSRAELTPPPLTATAFYFHDAQILAQAAQALDRADDAAEFATKANRIRASYNREFFKGDQSSYATGSQCANAIPLAFGIVPSEHREAVLASLVKEVESKDYAITAGDIGFRFLLQALAQGGRSDVVYRMINRDDQPGYGFQLKQGATSLTESWDAKLTASHNHFMLGHIIEWIYQDLCGIASDPAGPGFKKIIIKPNPVGDLTWAEASYDSVRGTIKVRWDRTDGSFNLKVSIPPNTSATVYMPGRQDEGSTSNREVGSGVRLLRRASGRLVYSISSGVHELRSEF